MDARQSRANTLAEITKAAIDKTSGLSSRSKFLSAQFPPDSISRRTFVRATFASVGALALGKLQLPDAQAARGGGSALARIASGSGRRTAPSSYS